MKPKLKQKGKKLLTIAVSCLMLFGMMPGENLQVFAADSTKGIETNVDKTELDKAVKAAKDAGVPIKKVADVDKGIAKSKSDVNTKIAEIKKDYEDQIKAIRAEIQKKKDCDVKQKEYEAAKKKYDEEMVAYNKAMAELEKHKHDDGYLKQPQAQSLIFESEPNAKSNITTGNKVYEKNEWYAKAVELDYVKETGGNWPTLKGYAYSDFKSFNDSVGEGTSFLGKRIFLEKDKPVVVEYTNLENSTFNGEKIDKVEYTYVLKSYSKSQKMIPVFIYQNPNVTISYSPFLAEADIEMSVKFFAKDGNVIDVKDALLDFSSLNVDHAYPTDVFPELQPALEKVVYHTGEGLEINGSSITVHPDGLYGTSNTYVERGAKYPGDQWDKPDSELNWYGAIVGKQKEKNIRFNISARSCTNVWFAFDSKVKPKGIPIKPVEPKEPNCPKIDAEYHYDILFYQPPVEKKVLNTADENINNSVVKKDATVKFSLNVEDLPAGREKIESLVFTDKLPDGYEVNLAETKQASSDYNVNYNNGTNVIEFTAKSAFIDTANADLSKEVKIPAPLVVGKVTKAGTTYKNDFNLDIDNEYSVKSKPVKVTTPPDPTKPVKDVFDIKDTTTSIDGKVVKAEEELLYKVTYKNTTGKTEDVEIKDEIPKYTKYIENSADNGGKESGGVITWTKKALGDGETFTVSFKVKVDKDVNGKPIDNQAKVNAGENKFDTNKTHNPTPTQPEKKVFKEGTTTNIDGKRVEPEDELTYAITYKNTTGKDVKAIITDKLPKHTTFVSAENGGKFADGKVTWNLDVAKDKSVTVKFTVKVDKDVNGKPIDNKARVNDGNNDYDTNETHNPTPTQPEKEVLEFGTTTKIDGKRVEPGQKITYAITYKNTTGEDADVTITDKVPAHTKFVSADNDGKESGGVVTWKQKVSKDDVLVVTFTVQVDQDVNGAPIKNKAKANDGYNDYDTNEVTNPTPTQPEKKVFKGGTTTNIDGKRVEPEDELTYAITYKNTTGKDVKAVITDKLPKYTTFVSAENDGKFADGKVTWNLDVAKDKSVTVKFTVKVDKDVNGKPIDNKARVNDGKNDYDTNETHNPTPTQPEKEVFKGGTTTKIDGKKVNPGDELTYAVTYKNTTGKDVDATITDKIPAHTTFVSADNGGVNENGTVKWTKKVASGDTWTVKFTVKVDKDVNGEVLRNRAKVNDGENDYDTNEVTNPTPEKPTPPKNPEPKKPHGPGTGDDSNIAFLLMLLLASGGALGTTTYIRRKRQ